MTFSLAVRRILAEVRNDKKAFPKLVAGVRDVMEHVLDTSGCRDAPHTAETLLDETLVLLSGNKTDAISDAIRETYFEDALEDFIVVNINRECRFRARVGKWHIMFDTINGGYLSADLHLFGEIQPPGTEHPGDNTYEKEYQRILVGALGASEAALSWELTCVPRNWIHEGEIVTKYSGRVRWFYSDGDAALVAMGRVELLKLAEMVLAKRKKSDAEI